MEVHHAPDGVAAVGHGARAVHHLGAFQGVGIHPDHVLQVAGPIDGVVHAHAVHHDQHPVGRETTQHGAAAPELALLHEDLAALLQQVGRCARILEGHVARPHHGDLVGYAFAFLFPAVGAHDVLAEADGPHPQRYPVQPIGQHGGVEDTRLVAEQLEVEAVHTGVYRQLRAAPGIGVHRGGAARTADGDALERGAGLLVHHHHRLGMKSQSSAQQEEEHDRSLDHVRWLE